MYAYTVVAYWTLIVSGTQASSVLIQSDLAYPVLFCPDPSPSGRKSLVTDLQHNYVMHAYSMCVRLSGSLAYPDILRKTDVCG